MYWADQCPHKNQGACTLLTENISEYEEENFEKVNDVFMIEDIMEKDKLSFCC